MAGLEKARADGKILGRPRVAPDTKLLEKVRKLRESNTSIRRIAAKLQLSHGAAQRLAAL